MCLPIAPKPEDRKTFEERLGASPEFGGFTKSGFWDLDGVLRPIYSEASEKLGRELPYRETTK